MKMQSFLRAKEILAKIEELKSAKRDVELHVRENNPRELTITVNDMDSRPSVIRHIPVPISTPDMIDLLSTHINAQIQKLEYEFEKL